MKWYGNIRKMRVSMDPIDHSKARYLWCGMDRVESLTTTDIHDWIGKEVAFNFDGEINCVVSGKRIKKTFGEGMSYDAWLKAPQAVASVFNPELSRIHEGVALRDQAWEEEHHNQPHVVYISQTSGLKVGVTRVTNVPYRWIDQGATGAIVVANTPYRQLAGELEVALKANLADKTNFRKMLMHVEFDSELLLEARESAFDWLGEAYESFFEEHSAPFEIHYPVEHYPEKINSIRLDKVPHFHGVLQGIKGQYLLFDGNRVFNVRSHAGYRVSIEV